MCTSCKQILLLERNINKRLHEMVVACVKQFGRLCIELRPAAWEKVGMLRKSHITQEEVS